MCVASQENRGNGIVFLLLKPFSHHLIQCFFVDGIKTVEGRCAVGDYNRYCLGENFSLIGNE